MLEIIYTEIYFAARSNLVKFASKKLLYFFACSMSGSCFLLTTTNMHKSAYFCPRLEDNASDPRA